MTLKLLLISSEDTGEERDLYLGSETIAVIADSNINNIIKIFLNNFFQNKFFQKMRGRNFILDCIDKTYSVCQKKTFKRGSSYMEPPNWLKIRKQL